MRQFAQVVKKTLHEDVVLLQLQWPQKDHNAPQLQDVLQTKTLKYQQSYSEGLSKHILGNVGNLAAETKLNKP